MSRGKFCPGGNFVWGEILSRGKFCPGEILSEGLKLNLVCDSTLLCYSFGTNYKPELCRQLAREGSYSDFWRLKEEKKLAILYNHIIWGKKASAFLQTTI